MKKKACHRTIYALYLSKFCQDSRVRCSARISRSQQSIGSLSTAATLIDAAIEFARGRPGSSALLVGAAALPRYVPGLGTVVSVLLRIVRRLR